MSATCCKSGGVSRGATLVQRCAGVARWIVPASVLALLPKCPACVGAYVALATGVGISVTAAAYLRNGAIVVCIAMLLYAAAKMVRRFLVNA